MSSMRCENPERVFDCAAETVSATLPKNKVGPVIDWVSIVKATLTDTSCSAEERISRANSLLTSVAAPATGLGAAGSSKSTEKGGLAPWQTRRVKLFVQQRLSFPISCRELAQAVGLSPSHFTRAFAVSNKMTPHVYVTRARVEHGCTLMKSTTTPLSQISIECGFSDQAHFNRIFLKFIGVTPGRWRRMQNAPSMKDTDTR